VFLVCDVGVVVGDDWVVCFFVEVGGFFEVWYWLYFVGFFEYCVYGVGGEW